MQPRLPVEVLAGESQVDRHLRSIAVRVVVGRRCAEGVALPAPDDRLGLIARRARRIQVIRLQIEHRLRAAGDDQAHGDVITPDVGDFGGACRIGFHQQPVVQVVEVEDGADTLGGGGRRHFPDTPVLPVVVVAGEQRPRRAALMHFLELPGSVPDVAEASGLGDVAGGVERHALPGDGHLPVAVGRVGVCAAGVARAVAVRVVGEGLGFGGASFVLEAVEGVVTVGGGAGRADSLDDIAIDVVAQGFVGLRRIRVGEQRQPQRQTQDQGAGVAVRVVAQAQAQQQGAEQDGAPLGQGRHVAVGIGAAAATAGHAGDAGGLAGGVEGPGFADAVAEGLGGGCTESVGLDVLRQSD